MKKYKSYIGAIIIGGLLVGCGQEEAQLVEEPAQEVAKEEKVEAEAPKTFEEKINILKQFEGKKMSYDMVETSMHGYEPINSGNNQYMFMDKQKNENDEYHFAIFTFNSDETIIKDIETSLNY